MLSQNFSRIFRQIENGRKVVLANLVAVTFMLSSCGGSQTDDVICTAEARTSVMLTVVDALNNKLPDVSVNYSVNNAAMKQQECDVNGVCSLEFEVLGEFNMTASKSGYESASAKVNVTRSECHVNTERVVLTLKLL